MQRAVCACTYTCQQSGTGSQHCTHRCACSRRAHSALVEWNGGEVAGKPACKTSLKVQEDELEVSGHM